MLVDPNLCFDHYIKKKKNPLATDEVGMPGDPQ